MYSVIYKLYVAVANLKFPWLKKYGILVKFNQQNYDSNSIWQVIYLHFTNLKFCKANDQFKSSFFVLLTRNLCGIEMVIAKNIF